MNCFNYLIDYSFHNKQHLLLIKLNHNIYAIYASNENDKWLIVNG